jgi:hypothetical protein
MLSRLKIVNKSQDGLNGHCDTCSNMWIVKPAAKSRGRGIMTFGDIRKLLAYIDMGPGRTSITSTQWIVQKYMENSLVIANRKFDMRQWVLVADWNPLTIYFYDEFYARFSVDEYTTNENSLDNAYVHLVNNSIGKNSENFNKPIKAENGTDIVGYMMNYKDFSEYIKWKSGRDLVTSKIKPHMKNIAKWSLMCAVDAIEHRKNSWELYGFDFMVDDDYNPWLIEINSSPACDYSTKVTEVYVQKALVEILNVVLDVRAWDALPKKSRGEKPPTGGWECIYQGPYLETPSSSFGTDMTVKGESIRAPRRKVAGPSPGVHNNNGNFKLSQDDQCEDDDSSEEGNARDITTHAPSNRATKNPPFPRKSFLNTKRIVVGTEDIPTDTNVTDSNSNTNNNSAMTKMKKVRSSTTTKVEINDSDESDEDRRHREEDLSSNVQSHQTFAQSNIRNPRNLSAGKDSKKNTSGAMSSDIAPIPIKVFTVEF